MELLQSLLIPYNGGLIHLSSLRRLAGDHQHTMAAAAVTSSPAASQEQHKLPFRSQLDTFNPPPSAQPALAIDNPLQISGSDLAKLQTLEELFGPAALNAQDGMIHIPSKKDKLANKVKLQLRGDLQRIKPNYECTSVCQQFIGKVTYGNDTFEADSLFPSKADAEDAAAKVALEKLPLFDAKQVAGKKRKSDDWSPPPIDRSEDCISILVEHHKHKGTFEPSFDIYEVKDGAFSLGFKCKVTLKGGPLKPFEAGVVPRKKDAKAGSAKLAVEWLRSNRHLHSPVKRFKPCSEDGHTGLTQAVDDVGFDNTNTKSQSFRARVHQLAAALGLQQPSCQPTLSLINGKSEGSFWDAAAIFKPVDVAREPALAGPIGQVAHVFGKDNAKEDCNQRVLPVLEAIKQRRLASYQG